MAAPKVLIVDDEPAIVTALQDAFEDCGFAVETARSGAAALARIQEASPDAVLLDKNMPGMSGVEVLREIREMSGSIAVVLITAYGSAATAKESLNIGVDAYIEKPFPNIYQVVATIRDALRKRGRGPAALPPRRSVLVVGEARTAELLGGYLDGTVVIDVAPGIDGALRAVKQDKPGFIAIDAGAFAAQDTTAIVSAVRAHSDAAVLVVSERPLNLSVLKMLTELGVTSVCDTASELKDRVGEMARQLPVR